MLCWCSYFTHMRVWLRHHTQTMPRRAGEASTADTLRYKVPQTQLKGVCLSSQFHSSRGKAQGLTGSIRGGRSLWHSHISVVQNLKAPAIPLTFTPESSGTVPRVPPPLSRGQPAGSATLTGPVSASSTSRMWRSQTQAPWQQHQTLPAHCAFLNRWTFPSRLWARVTLLPECACQVAAASQHSHCTERWSHCWITRAILECSGWTMCWGSEGHHANRNRQTVCARQVPEDTRSWSRGGPRVFRQRIWLRLPVPRNWVRLNQT